MEGSKPRCGRDELGTAEGGGSRGGGPESRRRCGACGGEEMGGLCGASARGEPGAAGLSCLILAPGAGSSPRIRGAWLGSGDRTCLGGVGCESSDQQLQSLP